MTDENEIKRLARKLNAAVDEVLEVRLAIIQRPAPPEAAPERATRRRVNNASAEAHGLSVHPSAVQGEERTAELIKKFDSALKFIWMNDRVTERETAVRVLQSCLNDASSSPTATAQRGEDDEGEAYRETPLESGCTCPSWHTAGSHAVSGWVHHSACALNQPDPLPAQTEPGERDAFGRKGGPDDAQSMTWAELVNRPQPPSPAPECAHETANTREPFNYLGMPGTCKLCGKPVELRWATAPSLPTEGEGP